MHRRLPLITILATMLLGSVAAGAEPPDAAPAASWFSGATLSCSGAVPSVTLGCYVERRIATLGPVEIAVGVDAEAVFNAPSGGDAALVLLQANDAPGITGHLAPYGVAAWYADGWSAWAELRLPSLSGIPAIGDSDFLRVGFTTRF